LGLSPASREKDRLGLSSSLRENDFLGLSVPVTPNFLSLPLPPLTPNFFRGDSSGLSSLFLRGLAGRMGSPSPLDLNVFFALLPDAVGLADFFVTLPVDVVFFIRRPIYRARAQRYNKLAVLHLFVSAWWGKMHRECDAIWLPRRS
jgi:hypothetical protein